VGNRFSDKIMLNQNKPNRYPKTNATKIEPLIQINKPGGALSHIAAINNAVERRPC
jgi:hypothetical protein